MNWNLKSLRFGVLSAALAGLAAEAAPQALAGGVVEALQRPSLVIEQPESSVLLGAAIAENGRLVAVGERGLVVLSDDAGESWRQVSAPVSVSLTAVCFAGSDGVAVGHGGVVLISADGGESWSLSLNGRRAADLVMANAKASKNPELLEYAQLMLEEGPDKPFLDVALREDGRILAVGAYGLALVSSDFGKTWTSWMDRLDNPEGLHLYSVSQRGPVIVIAGERGLLLRSEDRGEHFSAIETPYAGSFFTTELLSRDEMIVAGLKGSLLHSRNGGQSWTQVENRVQASFTASSLAADGTLYLVDQAGRVMTWERGGLAQTNSKPQPALNAVLPINDQKVVLLSTRGVSTLRLAGYAEVSGK